MESPVSLRKELIAKCRRVVVKAGTRLLTEPESLSRIIRQIARIRKKGKQVILVSSGAVGPGMKLLGLKKRPSGLSEVQALAALGQVKLMAMYQEECAKHDFRAAQLLLTADDLRDRERHINTLNCLETLLSQDILPIVNENDPVSVSGLKFGDNDILASLLACMTRADLTIILTTVDGLLTPLPDGSFGDRISVVRGVTDAQRDMARGTDNAEMSIGGMASKLKAADTLNAAGEALWLASGKGPDILEEIFAGKDVGTLFLPPEGEERKLESKKRWIASFSRISGRITVDRGAATALAEKGRSLLPSGVTGISGTFKRGDVVEVCDPEGNLVAKGLSNFSSPECRALAGCQSERNHEILKHDADEEIIHRNNMFVYRKH